MSKFESFSDVAGYIADVFEVGVKAGVNTLKSQLKFFNTTDYIAYGLDLAVEYHDDPGKGKKVFRL